MSILVLSEKPSVAVSIAAVLNAKERGDGFFSGGGYIVTWALGHLLELAAPESYDERYAKWRLSDLPIIPSKWKHEAVAKTRKQLKIVAGLMNRADVEYVVNAADSGREGEIIFRNVYDYAKSKLPVKRLWIQSMEDAAIRAGFDNLKNGADYDGLYASALCRSRADWLVGLNMTRAFSCLYNATLGVGRVQSPTLAMIAAREAEIAAFVKEPFYMIELDCGAFAPASEKRKDKTVAEAVRAACDGKTATLTALDRQQKTAAPPKLYDLTALQREANRLFGFTAQKTLDYAQSLYEKKLATYPRTDARFLTDDMAAGLPALVSVAAAAFGLSAGTVNVGQLINAAKVTDHHAILPTMSVGTADLSALPSGERDLLFMLAVRLLCAVGDKHVYEAVTATLDCEGNIFTARGKTVLSDGWKAVDTALRASLKSKPDTEDVEDEDGGALPGLSEGQRFENVPASLREGFTSPPKHFTEDSLLSAMESAGAENMPEDAERKGLGTPATRAGIIEKIIKSGFVERRKKNLIPLEKGVNLAAVLPDALKSPALTAEWEQKMLEVQRGETTAEAFMSGIVEMTTTLVRDNTAPIPEYAAMFAAPPKGDVIGVCPRCGGSVLEGTKGFFCDDRACGFKLWRDNKFFTSKKKELTKAVAAALLKDGKAAMKGLFSAKTGKTYDADVLLDDDGGQYVNFKLEFDQRKGGKKCDR